MDNHRQSASVIADLVPHSSSWGARGPGQQQFHGAVAMTRVSRPEMRDGEIEMWGIGGWGAPSEDKEEE